MSLFYNILEYKLKDEISGNGYFGKVYKIENVTNKNEYAVKIYHRYVSDYSLEQETIVKKCTVIHELDHPSIIKFIGLNFVSLTKSTQFQASVITELMPNGSLRNILDNKSNKLNPTKKYICLIGIADAMSLIHKRQILHENLRPESVFLDENYYPKVSDLGSFKILDKYERYAPVKQYFYYPPEVFEGEYLGPEADVYSFAFIAYEIITGNYPFAQFDKRRRLQFLSKIAEGWRPSFTDNVPEIMRNLIQKCWGDFKKRPSFDEIFQELSSNFSYSPEKIDEKEVNNYIKKLLLSKNKK